MASQEEVRRVSIYINGSEADMQLGQIEKGAVKLKNELRKLTYGTEEYKQKMLELRQVKQVLKDVNDEINGVSGAFGWLKTEVGKLGALATGFLGLQFITQQFQDIISQNAKLADSISDVQKTTGMSELEVRRLQKSFKTIDTRSSRAELTSLAEVAGKLGITGEENVLGFVRAADQINVALGKDLGNAEQAINDLGKLTEIFKIKDAYGLEEALLKTGSAINDLGAAGTANEGYIVEFTKRMGGIAPQAKMSIQDIMGLAATMDELGQNAEAGATSIGQFVMGMGQDVPKFAAIAKMSVKDFSQLLQSDGNAALIAVLKNVKASGEGIEGLAASMGMIGEEGARSTQALGALSSHLELLTARQEMSNASFEKGKSLTDEYNVKNNNFAATLERLSKKFNALTTNTTLTDFLIKVVNLTSKVVDGINKSMSTIAALVKMLVMGGAAWLTYSMYVGIANSSSLAFLVTLVKGESVMALSRTATIALAGVQALLDLNFKKAAQAARLLNVTMAANPIGMVIAAVAALVTGLILFKSEANNAVKVQESLNKVHADGQAKISDEKNKILDLVAVLKSETYQRQDKLKAIAKLRDLLPDHLQGYTSEAILAGQATTAIATYIRQLEKRANAEAAYEQMKELRAQRLKVEREGVDPNFFQNVGVVVSDMIGGRDYGQKFYNNAAANNKKQALKAIDEQLEALKHNFGEEINKSLINGENAGGAPAFDLKDATKDQLDDQLAKDTKALAQLKRGTDEYNKVAAEMFAIRKRLKEIGKDTGIGGGGEDPAKKAAANYRQLQEQVKRLSDKAFEDTLNKNEKEIKDAQDKYKTLIDKEKEFLKKEGVTAEQRKVTEANIAKLEKDMSLDVANITVRQEQEMHDKIIGLRNSLANAYETERQKEITRINAFYDELQSQAVDYAQFMSLEEDRAKDLADAKIREEKRLADETEEIRQQAVVTGTDRDKLELAKINKKYDDQVEALKKKYSKELQASKEFQAALALINKNRKNETDASDEEKKKDKNKAIIQAAYDTAKQASDAVFQIGADNRRAETDAKLAQLEKDKEAELSRKNLTESQKKAIEEKYAKEEADIKLKAWQADQDAKATQAEINGALAVTMALASSPPPFNWINAAAVAAATLAQVMVIKNEKPPQFEDGGFSAVDYSKPSGWVRSPTLFKNSSSGREFTAGEKHKTEYIISSEQLKDPVIANFVDMMEANRGVRRFEAGGYTGVEMQQKAVTIAPGNSSPVDLAPLLEEQRLTRLEMQQTRQAIKDMKVVLSMQELRREQDKIVQIENRANVG